MPDTFIVGLPGVRTFKTATHKIVFKQGDWLSDLALGKIIDGVNSRDPTNTGDLNVLQPGVLMGKITSTGLYAPAIIGPTTAVFTAGGTTLTVGAATATEVSRRLGASGTLTLVGPPAANGVVNTATVTYSAVGATTITITDPGLSFVSGSLIKPVDGSQTIKTLIPDGYGVIVTDVDGVTNISVQFPQFPIAGVIISSQLVNWPTDTSLQAHIVQQLNASSGGQFVFDHGY